MSLVAIVGRPNVGKSTLFNRLVGERKAIVDATAGTTRDRHYGKTDWNGREFSVIDTGGYTVNSEDIFEDEIRRQVLLAIDEADVILVGVSRSGKTPTSLFLAMQYGIKVANYPLIPEDFDRGSLPDALLPLRHKLFGLSIRPERLSEIRNERRPGSRYASIENCRQEIFDAENLMRREGIRWLNSTTKSIEEISATIMSDLGLDKRKA